MRIQRGEEKVEFTVFPRLHCPHPSHPNVLSQVIYGAAGVLIQKTSPPLGNLYNFFPDMDFDWALNCH